MSHTDNNNDVIWESSFVFQLTLLVFVFFLVEIFLLNPQTVSRRTRSNPPVNYGAITWKSTRPLSRLVTFIFLIYDQFCFVFFFFPGSHAANAVAFISEALIVIDVYQSTTLKITIRSLEPFNILPASFRSAVFHIIMKWRSWVHTIETRWLFFVSSRHILCGILKKFLST
jgi:hypothetical protein